MDRDNPRLVRTASALVVWPIIGMVGGLVLGAVRASFLRADEIASLSSTIRWGVVGFFLGLAVIVVLSFSLRLKSKDLFSLRRLMILVAVTGVLCWYFTRILFGLIGY